MTPYDFDTQRDRDAFSNLVGRIYDTILDPHLWKPVLAAICDYSNAARTTLILEDRAQPSRSAAYQSYDDPEWTTRYITDYMLINPMRIATEPFVKAGDIVLTNDFMNIDEYRRTRIFREFLAERQLVDIAAAVLEKTATTITVLSLKRSVEQGFADEPLREKLKLLAPHVRRATSIGRIFAGATAGAETLALTLDKLEAAVMLLDASGRIVHRNSRAQTLLSHEEAVREFNGRVHLRDAYAREDLDAFLAAAELGQGTLDTRGIAIPLKRSADRSLMGVVMSLTDGARGAARAGHRAAALFCVQETTFAAPHAAKIISDLYGLTRRETSILRAIVELGGVPETAAALGLSEGTVKGYLKAVFRKTGTSRQAELVKLVAGTRSPFGI